MPDILRADENKDNHLSHDEFRKLLVQLGLTVRCVMSDRLFFFFLCCGVVLCVCG